MSATEERELKVTRPGVVGIHGIQIPRELMLARVDELMAYAEKGEPELLAVGAEWHRRGLKKAEEKKAKGV